MTPGWDEALRKAFYAGMRAGADQMYQAMTHFSDTAAHGVCNQIVKTVCALAAKPETGQKVSDN